MGSGEAPLTAVQNAHHGHVHRGLRTLAGVACVAAPGHQNEVALAAADGVRCGKHRAVCLQAAPVVQSRRLDQHDAVAHQLLVFHGGNDLSDHLAYIHDSVPPRFVHMQAKHSVYLLIA